MRSEFGHICFEDPAVAERRLSTLLEPERPGIVEQVAGALSESSEPGTVLMRLERFLEASPAPAEELDRMAGAPRYARLLCTLLDQSHFLTDTLCLHPEYAWWLQNEAVLRRARSREEMAAEVIAQTAECASLADCARVMRQIKQREILRIAARDIVMHVPLPSVTEDLSNLAEAVLEAAFRFSSRLLTQRFGKPMAETPGGCTREVAFVIIGMGKLGGRELNFSSDVDLLFIYSDDGETSGGPEGSVSCAEYYQKLGEQIVGLVSEQTADGHIFRVDMRLRPHGRLSPLAADLESTLNYYVQYGQAWERQALIKARPVAGDFELGKEFIEQTRPFAFPRYFDDETLDAIREIKQQKEAEIADRRQTDIEVKLGRGGIRDIEFTVQILQMLNGGRMLEFRTSNTLDAIKALDTRGILRAFEATSLASNYAFMRRVEHRLQIEGSQQRHVLPSDAAALDRFARKLGYSDGASFMAEYHERAEESRGILDRFVSPEISGYQWVYDLLSVQTDGEIGMTHLEGYGFKDPVKARNELLLLSGGPTEQPYPLHVRQQFAEIAPTLLEALGACPDPDATLIRLSRILTNLRAPGAIYDTLKGNPSLCRHLTTLVSNSQYLSEILVRDPSLFDSFSSRDALNTAHTREDLEAELANLRRAYDPEAAPCRLRDGETLRIGIRELFCGATVQEVGQELTQLAEVCLDYALERARTDVTKRYGAAHGAFAILGLGKLGGREMGYGSDLDLVFAYDADAKVDSGMAASEYFAALAANTMRRLKEPTRYGVLYDIDARLRPDGNKGVLAVNDRRLEEYYREDAEAWERLAIIKVRAVAGDAEFGKRIEERLRAVVFSVPVTGDSASKIEGIRKRTVQSASDLHLKKGEGGLAGIEFAVRLLQLRHGGHFPDLQRGDVLGALEALERHGVAEKHEIATLRDAYLLFRRIENRLRLMHGRSTSLLPEDPAAQAELTQRLGVEGDIVALTREYRVKVQAIYAKILSGTADVR